MPGAPLHPYRPSFTDLAKEDESNGHKILEVPLTICRLGFINIPISGGFYIRSLPFPVLKALIKKSFKGGCIVLYLHPWEIVPIAPRASLPLSSRFITYFNINSTISKLKNLLINFDFSTMEEIVDEF